MSETETCRKRWKSNKDGRIRDIRKLWKLYLAGDDEGDPEIGSLNDYGLSFDFAPSSATGCGFFRWQLSTGGPGDELRFYVSPDLGLGRVEYWFLDWFDGYGRPLTGADFDLLTELWGDFFRETGAARYALEAAGE